MSSQVLHVLNILVVHQCSVAHCLKITALNDKMQFQNLKSIETNASILYSLVLSPILVQKKYSEYMMKKFKIQIKIFPIDTFF